MDSNKDDQQIIAFLFKRSIHESDASLSITFASSLTEARNLLSQEQFDIITLDGEFPYFIDARLGHTIIPFIKEEQQELPIIMMISSERLYIKQGLKCGADFAFYKQDILNNLKLNDQFQLVPLRQAVSVWNHLNLIKFCGISTDFFLTMKTIFVYSY